MKNLVIAKDAMKFINVRKKLLSLMKDASYGSAHARFQFSRKISTNKKSEHHLRNYYNVKAILLIANLNETKVKSYGKHNFNAQLRMSSMMNIKKDVK